MWEVGHCRQQACDQASTEHKGISHCRHVTLMRLPEPSLDPVDETELLIFNEIQQEFGHFFAE